MSKARSVKVTAAVNAIRAFYALGQSLDKKEPHKDAYGQGKIDAEAKKHGLNADTIRKARQFVAPDVGYTPEELKKLCQSIMEVQSDQDDTLSVFGRTHVIRLLSTKKHQRRKLQESAIREGWSCSKLEAEIAARFGSRRDGGRRRLVPGDLLGLLAQLEQICETWRRWHSQLSEKPIIGDFPELIHELLGDADAAMSQLHRAVTGDLKTHRPGRGVRQQFRG